MTDFIDEDYLEDQDYEQFVFGDDEEKYTFDEPEYQETFGEMQQKEVKKFCDEFHTNKTVVALCKEYKKYGLDGSNIVEELQDNIYLPFLNPQYVVLAKIFEGETKEPTPAKIKKFVKTHNLDMADFIRYIEINKNYLNV